MDSIAVSGPAEAQHGRFRTIDFYDGTGSHFFYREAGQPTSWTELNLSYWLSEFNSLPFISAREVALTPVGPPTLLLVAGGGVYGSGSGTQVNYTFIIDLAGLPTLVWQSADFCEEEIKPTQVNAEGEMEGGNFAQASRDISVRNGLVHVARMKQEGKFASTDNTTTPITPGYYRYQAGRFRWVTR